MEDKIKSPKENKRAAIDSEKQEEKAHSYGYVSLGTRTQRGIAATSRQTQARKKAKAAKSARKAMYQNRK